jgi:hypothetical protein
MPGVEKTLGSGWAWPPLSALPTGCIAAMSDDTDARRRVNPPPIMFDKPPKLGAADIPGSNVLPMASKVVRGLKSGQHTSSEVIASATLFSGFLRRLELPSG